MNDRTVTCTFDNQVWLPIDQLLGFSEKLQLMLFDEVVSMRGMINCSVGRLWKVLGLQGIQDAFTNCPKSDDPDAADFISAHAMDSQN
ncbi:hypothetical protein D3C81_2150520 [compost metagenome]